MSFPIPNVDDVDIGSVPSRSTKSITLKVSTPTTDVTEQSLDGGTFKFRKRFYVDVYVRSIKGAGQRIGREPPELVALEKWLVDYFAIHKLDFREHGIQYIEVIGTQTLPERVGGEEAQQIWFHLRLVCNAHFWLRNVES